MTLELTPPSISAEGNLRIKFVDTVADIDAPTVAEWDGGVDITYSLTPDGWAPTQDQGTVVDDRLSLAQALERPGKKTKSLVLRYVYGTDEDIAAEELEEGTAGYFLVRVGPNEDAGAAGQKVTVWPILAGEQMEQPPAANGVFTMQQKAFVTGRVAQRVALTTGD